MNKKISYLAILATLILPFIANAQIKSYGGITLNRLIPNIESLAWTVFACIVVVCFVVAGVMFLTAQGEPEKVKAARSSFIWGVAGVIVGILAYSIERIITGIL